MNKKSLMTVLALLVSSQSSASVAGMKLSIFAAGAARFFGPGKFKVGGGKLWDGKKAKEQKETFESMKAEYAKVLADAAKRNKASSKTPKGDSDLTPRAPAEQIRTEEQEIEGIQNELQSRRAELDAEELNLRAVFAPDSKEFTDAKAKLEADELNLQTRRQALEQAKQVHGSGQDETEGRFFTRLFQRVQGLFGGCMGGESSEPRAPGAEDDGNIESLLAWDPIRDGADKTLVKDVTDFAKKFENAFGLDGDSSATDKDTEYDIKMVSGKMLDLSIGFSAMMAINEMFSIGGFVKAGWTNSEYSFLDSYKLAASIYGALGVVLGFTDYVQLRLGLGLYKYTLNFDPSEELKTNMDCLKGDRNFFSTKEQGEFDKVVNVSGDYSKARSADANSVQFLGELVLKYPVSDNVDLMFTAGMNTPFQHMSFDKVGQNDEAITIKTPTAFTIGVGIGYNF